jgi:hypothetical protein
MPGAPLVGPVPADRIGDGAHPARIAVVVGDAARGHVARRRTTSSTEAVVVVEYCGYSGSTTTRWIRSRRSAAKTSGMDGSAVAHRMHHARLRHAQLTAAASRCV